MNIEDFLARLAELTMLPRTEENPEVLIHIRGLGWYSPTSLDMDEGDLVLEIDYDPRKFADEQADLLEEAGSSNG